MVVTMRPSCFRSYLERELRNAPLLRERRAGKLEVGGGAGTPKKARHRRAANAEIDTQRLAQRTRSEAIASFFHDGDQNEPAQRRHGHERNAAIPDRRGAHVMSCRVAPMPHAAVLNVQGRERASW